MRLLVTGPSGYVGALLAGRLLADGHDVRGFARRPERVTVEGLDVVAGDAVTGAGLATALHGVDVAYFLIHAMETSSGAAFAERELEAARRFAGCAREAGVRRIVYLGGPVPSGTPSAHLSSRLAVERVLMEALPESVTLRASIVIGARSRSFRFLVRLVERLRVMALPGWADHRTAPIDERDVLEMLVRAAGARLPATDDGRDGHVLDAVGPEVVSYGGLISRIAELMVVDRPTVSLGRLTLTPVASRVAAAIAGEDPGLVGPLMESLAGDLLATGPDAALALGVKVHSLDAAIEHALRDWEATGTLAAR